MHLKLDVRPEILRSGDEIRLDPSRAKRSAQGSVTAHPIFYETPDCNFMVPQ